MDLRERQDWTMKRLGLIVNPIAGMGGRVGLKGTDGDDAYLKALSLGAQPQSHRRAVEALTVIADAMPEISLITCAGVMGEDAARRCGFSPILIESTLGDKGRTSDKNGTSPADTRLAALEMQRIGVDLLLFAGGDGTARDIYDSLSSREHQATQTPALGIPAGVKMHSGVFAINPRRAGEIASSFLRGESVEVTDAEVMDIDEVAFREGRVTATLHGYLKVPQDSHGIQHTKSGTAVYDDEPSDIARQVVSKMADDILYIVGPGTTTAAIADMLRIPNTLLGVDVILNQKPVAMDATETELLEMTENRPAKIVVTAIGGQGHIFGRGNQQISPSVIRQVGLDNIIVVAARRKILDLRGQPFLVDTGDPMLDEELSGYIEVVTGFRESHIYKVAY